MARTREFDTEKALEDAMQAFWDLGYGETSIEDLVARTGVSRYGLYSAFESKEGLFLAALGRYQDKIVGAMFGPVETPDAGRAAIEAYFDRLIRAARKPNGARGCLMCNTAADVADDDALFAEKVAEYQRRLQDGFSRALKRARARGEIAADLPIAATADYLLALAMGMLIAVRSRVPLAHIKNMADVGLRVLG